ncbi:MAG: DUF5788 family protein [Methanomassiliicoccales archaeon]
MKEQDKWDYDPNPLSPEDRKRILERIHSALYWVGKFIPEEEMVGGERIPLREVVFRYLTNPSPSPQEIQSALQLASALERKARMLEEELRTESGLTKGHAHILLDEICGILRAVEDIRNARGSEAALKAKVLMSKVDDERRWQEFLKSAYISSASGD